MSKSKKIFSLVLCFLTIIVSSAVAEPTKADIVFFIDASGSMTDYIEAVKSNVSSFTKQLVSEAVDARFLVISFSDNISYDYDSNSDSYNYSYVHSVDISNWTSNASEVETILASIDLGNNETQTHALNTMFDSVTFREDAEKFGFLLTDEPTSSNDHSLNFPNEQFITIDNVVSKFNNIGMSVSVISSIMYREHYMNLFTNTNGVFVDITQGDFYKSMLDIAKWIAEESNIASEDRLPYAMIEPVPYDIINRVSGDETVLERIAKLASIDVSQINVISIDTLDLSLPREPTEAMKQKVNGEFIAKTDTITLHSNFLSEGEDGYYLFQLNVPDELLSDDIKVENLRMYFATPDEFETSSVSKASMVETALFDPFSYFEITDLWGYKADTLAKKVLVLIVGNTGKSLSMWLIKTLLMFLGGCNVGFGVLSVSVASFLIWKLYKRHS